MWPLKVRTFCQTTCKLGSQHFPPQVTVCSRKLCCWPGVQHVASRGHTVLPKHHLAGVTTFSFRGRRLLPQLQAAGQGCNTFCPKHQLAGVTTFSSRSQLHLETLAAGQGCKAAASRGHNDLPKHQLARVTTFSSRGHSFIPKHVLLSRSATCGLPRSQRSAKTPPFPPEVTVCSRNTCCWPGIDHVASQGHHMLPKHQRCWPRVQHVAAQGHTVPLKHQVAGVTKFSSQAHRGLSRSRRCAKTQPG